MKIIFEERKVTGKKVASLRAAGKTPVVCYGNGENVGIYSVATKELSSVFSSEEVVFDTDGALPGKQVLIQSIFKHPLSGDPLHIDFLFVDKRQKVQHDVPLEIVGESPAVKAYGGQMIVVSDKVVIESLPQDIPSHIDIDISILEEIGSHVTAGDIKLGNGVTLITSPDDILVSIVEQVQEEEETEMNINEIEVVGQKGKKDEGGEESESSK